MQITATTLEGENVILPVDQFDWLCEQAAKADGQPEIRLLREVYEAARRVLRFNDVDRAKTDAAVDDLDAAIEKVKLLDSGLRHQEFV